MSAAQHEGGRSRAFMGSGYSMQGDSAAPVERNEDKEKIRHTITFWSNGFSVDDGPLRALVCARSYAACAHPRVFPSGPQMPPVTSSLMSQFLFLMKAAQGSARSLETREVFSWPDPSL